MNKLTIIGNVCHSPELRTTASGKDVATFTVAVNKKYGNTEQTDFFKVAAWGKLGQACAQHLEHGRKVCVVGEVTAHAYMGKNNEPRASLEVKADEVEFLSPKDNGMTDQRMAQTEAEQRAAAEQFHQEELSDSDLPF